jgi:hypothetical protein
MVTHFTPVSLQRASCRVFPCFRKNLAWVLLTIVYSKPMASAVEASHPQDARPEKLPVFHHVGQFNRPVANLRGPFA